jgi:protein O-GlcNAc transferase
MRQTQLRWGVPLTGDAHRKPSFGNASPAPGEDFTTFSCNDGRDNLWREQMKARNTQGAGRSVANATQQMLAAAVRLLQAGRFPDARVAYRQLLAADPENVLALHHLAVIEYQLGQSETALRLLTQCLGLKPDYAAAHSDRAVFLMQSGREDEAIEACERAIACDPRLAAAHSNLGDLLVKCGRLEAAERAYGRAVAVQPNFASAHASRADVLANLDRFAEARKACDKALRLSPDLAIAHGANGLILHKSHQNAEAIAAYRRALQLDPHQAIVHTRLANVLKDEGLLDEALAANTRALSEDPACVAAYTNQASVLKLLGRYQDSFEHYSNALTLQPEFVDALAGLGLLLHAVGDFEQAVEVLRRAVAAAPHAGFAYLNLGSVLKDQGRFAEAAEVYEAMLKACPGDPPAQGLYSYCNLRRHVCDWPDLDEAERRAIAALKASGQHVPPFASLAMSCTPSDHLDLARLWAAGFQVPATAAARLPTAKVTRSGRIRLGYLSADFFQHATASLIAELIERHDRDRFEVFAYCFSPEDGSPMRQRLKSAFDRFRIVEPLSHAEAARQIAADGIDILVDMKGYTRNARTMILAHRPAPIQVNYLGYPSTMGAPFIDYIIGDAIVSPLEHQPFFDERIVQLPDCYQPNDRRRVIGRPRSRADHGLPEAGFVFCSFNNAYKITAPVFDVWMRLLGQVPDSVLWLLDANELSKANLRRAATERGIDAERLIFAPKLPSAEHLARYVHADLFLDNLPVNAHTTASEALWSGLPVVTCLGEIFVGRVAASLLSACGLPELIADSPDAYAALALRLAITPGELAAIRAKLVTTRDNSPLFDTARYANQLDAAFAHMVHLHAEGRPPQAFAVADTI